MVVFADVADSRDPLLVDHMTARILELSEGGRTVRDIIEQVRKEDRSSTVDDEVAWFETLFIGGLIYLRHPEVVP